MPQATEWPRKLNLGLREDICNMACPKCLVFGGRPVGAKQPYGEMNVALIRSILDQVKGHGVVVNPSFWSEPTVASSFRHVIWECTQLGIPTAMNTNGLRIDQAMAKAIVNYMSSVMVSIDATTNKTFHAVRGSQRLEKVQMAVGYLLEARGDARLPRIGVSFSVEDANRHEMDDFIDYWLKRVDVVRVNGVYGWAKSISGVSVVVTREPCREIFDQMNIDWNGEARVCCLDGGRKTNLGNVAKEGVLAVWQGEAYQALRERHLTGNYAGSFCDGCSMWASYNVNHEEKRPGLLIRSSVSTIYYNKTDRLDTWAEAMHRQDLPNAFL